MIERTGELKIFEKQGFGNTLGFGDRPALVIIDFVVGFDDPAWFGGGNIHAAIEQTVGLLAAAREANLPIAHTRVVFAADGSDRNLLTVKIPSLTVLTEEHPAGQIVPALTPRPGELVLRKRNPSAFFETDFASWLTRRSVDTLIVAGCVTSGCVRATVVDALGYGHRPIVVTDCVGDRAIGPHDASLFDLGQKYADLMTRDEVLAILSARKGGSRQAAE